MVKNMFTSRVMIIKMWNMALLCKDLKIDRKDFDTALAKD